jgi:hypothetical protein
VSSALLTSVSVVVLASGRHNRSGHTQPCGCSLKRHEIRQDQSEQVAVNGWLGRADRRYSRTLAPPPPGRPVFTLWSSAQGVHVHRTNIASVALSGGSRWRCIGAPFRRVVEADVGEDCLAQVSASEARSAQIAGRQISAGHVGVAEVCPSQIGRRQSTRPAGRSFDHPAAESSWQCRS